MHFDIFIQLLSKLSLFRNLKNINLSPIVKYMTALHIPKLLQKTFLLFFLLSIRMSGKNINFGKKNIKKSNFCKSKKVVKIDDINFNKILVSKEKQYGTKNSFKCFIGYNDNDIIRLLCGRLPQMTGYARKFEFNSTMSFKISNEQLLKKYNLLWKKTEKLLKIKFDNKSVYDDDGKYIKTKIKTYRDSIITNLHSK